MPFDVQAILPKEGAEANPYHDPHEVYLMTLLLLQRVRATILMLLPPPLRDVRNLPVLIGMERDDIIGIFGRATNEWAHAHELPSDPAIHAAVQRAFAQAQRNLDLALGETS